MKPVILFHTKAAFRPKKPQAIANPDDKAAHAGSANVSITDLPPPESFYRDAQRQEPMLNVDNVCEYHVDNLYETVMARPKNGPVQHFAQIHS